MVIVAKIAADVVGSNGCLTRHLTSAEAVDLIDASPADSKGKHSRSPREVLCTHMIAGASYMMFQTT